MILAIIQYHKHTSDYVVLKGCLLASVQLHFIKDDRELKSVGALEVGAYSTTSTCSLASFEINFETEIMPNMFPAYNCTRTSCILWLLSEQGEKYNLWPTKYIRMLR